MAVVGRPSAAIGAVTYGVTKLFGNGALGPVVVSIAALAASAALFMRRAERGAPVAAEGA